ncbi:MAG: hypothetical protein ABUL62_21490 [Myxococcales bacterium]
MTKRAPSSVRLRLAARRHVRALPGLVALGLVLLQLATALHFALIPHSFNAGLSGFEHVHRVLVNRAIEREPDRPSLVTGAPSCAPDTCPIGFAGPVSVLLAPAAATARIALPIVNAALTHAPSARSRAQLLLAAPKTSPPRRA